jgi:hypothetical protein
VKERAYTSLGRPKLEYRSSAWDPHTKYPIHQVEMVQREAAYLLYYNFRLKLYASLFFLDVQMLAENVVLKGE